MEDIGAALDMLTKANRKATNKFASLGKNRPYALSAKSPYTSWDSLTDQNYYSRQLPPADQEWVDSLPPLEDVTELFRHDGQRKESKRTTMLFATFAQFAVENLVSTGANSDGSPKYDHYTGTNQWDMMSVYGRTIAQTNALRAMNNTQGYKGRLKSQILHGEEFPHFLHQRDGTVDPQFIPLLQDATTRFANSPSSRRCQVLQNIDNSTFFAMGHMDANLLPNIVSMITLFLREHNRIAGTLEEINPSWDDERVFQTARNINIVIGIKIVFHEYINHIAKVPIFQLDIGPWIWNATWNRPNWIAAEFSVLYRFHTMVPSTINVAGEQLSLMESLGRNDLFQDGTLSLREMFEDLSAQKAMSMELFNTDSFLLGREKESLRMSRALKFASYADYVEYMDYQPRPTSFEDISSDPKVLAKLKDLYTTVDDVEFYVGLVAQDHEGNAIFGGTLLAAIGKDAMSTILVNPLLSENVWNEETFSEYGWQLIHEDQSLAIMLDRNAADGWFGEGESSADEKPYIGMGANAPLPDIGEGSATVAENPVEEEPLASASSTTSWLFGMTVVCLSSLLSY
ncbi:Prostaglandin G/H synthase [Seminavis robusta]|uniref:Prostaglandin G/H synthase n=1 Tax=Seminavis robusta TaxID=568900 RepID=A0A9N8DQD4_9STRA|nr:Prostaglandin G/H synthase [Seminavis robusta]|eukprot:Sro277_g106250.1 Prostaglandin G/H synthase (571) ;mRNA; f:29690-31402